MSAQNKTLAKSLHTVTALARIAEHLLTEGPEYGAEPFTISKREAVDLAAKLLGYADAADPYNLKVAALAAMTKGL